ncbi:MULTISPECIES: alpha/beta hydrolase family protein [Ralstonia solanacearum species complex]|uniref:alpha/beta hydrolase family protein n=1 Tax=Ralstonia solanacearum species complex TaxID=3116862 RepID=UPI00078B653C|nr:esterase [Ralstonia solanacearum]BEU74837.1 alpha/beta hydrolase [Ralstonia pseudosolanacearum]AMP40227.1 esterase [Ralstonia solanacearum]AXV79648.1 alpha/beta hydrolase [Ralstonia solanacearum]AXV89083.1 alpha/beta hydrolase [Ralstonia solanacearum]AXV93681.1 alpha/beta hydrolase [Ralstonia solanacearum]
MPKPVSTRSGPRDVAAGLSGAMLSMSLMSGCTVLDRNAHAEAQATPAGLHREQIDTGGFVLTAYSRIARPDAPLDLYIEGDGLAWISRSEPSLDPTPRDAVGLALAAADPAPNIAYLARPCQFTPMAMNPRCGVPYWTGKRFAPEVVASIDQAVSHFAARVPGQRIHLVGYSGGGALAVLVAARRTDVASIRTVAGNLDHAFVNRLHDVSSMPQSENAIDFAARVASIPQVHFSGADDTVVPPIVAQRFVDATGKRCAQARTVPGVAHGGDWSRLWPLLLGETPVCREPSGINQEHRAKE